MARNLLYNSVIYNTFIVIGIALQLLKIVIESLGGLTTKKKKSILIRSLKVVNVLHMAGKVFI